MYYVKDKKGKNMEFIIGFFIVFVLAIVIPAIVVFGEYTNNPQKNRHVRNNYHDSEEDNDE